MGLLRRLYRGDTEFDFVGPRKRWYLTSLVLLLICIGSLTFKGFNYGIEFAGGTQFLVPKAANTSLEDARSAAEDQGIEVATVQEAGTGATTNYVIKTGELEAEEQREVRAALARDLSVAEDQITISEVSSSWGQAVTQQAFWGLIVFLVLVAAYLWVRFEQKMAIAALIALAHDLLFTAGAYSLVGFEVTPGTVVGMLTILGYSLYDTVVVFDKVQENTKGLLGTTRQTYGEAANLAVNQTLMRSINTSIIGLLPVAGLLFVGAGLLGVGTLKDLALVLFVGMLTGTFSSLFIATPALVDFKMLEPRYRAQQRRVFAKRSGDDSGVRTRRQGRRGAGKAEANDNGRADDDGRDGEDSRDGAASDDETFDSDDAQLEDERELAGSAPRPGSRPAAGRERKRSGGKGPSRGGRGGGKRKK